MSQFDCGLTQVIETEYTEATESMIYLNLNNPAQCFGTISSYQYCHYPITRSGGVRFHAILAVFRMMGDSYQPVSGSNIVLEERDSLPFTCDTSTLTTSVEIQPGDVLGACVGRESSGGNRRQLNLAGDNANGFSVSGVSVSVCDPDNLQDLTALVPSLVDMPGRILHLTAEFSKLFRII